MVAAFCGLLRGCEFSTAPGELFDELRHLTRADLTFRQLRDGRWLAVLMIHLAKNGRMLTGKTTPVFLVSGGSMLDPVLELKRMVELDPVDVRDEAVTPLFRVNGQALRRDQVASMV